MRQWRIEGDGRRLVVWRWFEVGGTTAANPYVAKLLQLGALVGSDGSAQAVTLAAAIEGREAAEAALASFCRAHGGALRLSVLR